MKKYSLIWTINLALFNLIIFVTPNEIGGISKFSSSFWVGYIFITIAFLGQLACVFVTFKSNNLQKFFYNIPLISLSYSGLIAMLIAGSVFMAVPVLPTWIGIIVCAVILAFNMNAIIKASAAAEIVNAIDEEIKNQTFFIKNLLVEAQTLMAFAKSDELLAEAKKVYETIRYSDPLENSALSALDAQIERQFNAFSDAIKTDSAKLSQEMSATLIVMLEKRNQKCKLLK